MDRGAWGLQTKGHRVGHDGATDPMDCSMPGFPVLHYLPEFAQIHAKYL